MGNNQYRKSDLHVFVLFVAVLHESAHSFLARCKRDAGRYGGRDGGYYSKAGFALEDAVFGGYLNWLWIEKGGGDGLEEEGGGEEDDGEEEDEEEEEVQYLDYQMFWILLENQDGKTTVIPDAEVSKFIKDVLSGQDFNMKVRDTMTNSKQHLQKTRRRFGKLGKRKYGLVNLGRDPRRNKRVKFS
ncbi:hypothetical protein HDV00_001810 [Rhizophlyctis rosea]|nr:hypothetical protein HDV00_001810 [Rhizophlyctis rosea]